MKAFMGTYLAVLLLCSLLLQLSDCSPYTAAYDNDIMQRRYQSWIQAHGKTYKDKNEWILRFGIYQSNVQLIDYINAQNLSFRLADNEFADLTNEEFKSIYLGFKAPAVNLHNQSFRYENYGDLPTSVDWRKQGAVTPVKNQGECGSCWAFSSVAAIEGIHKIKSGKLVALSEQALVDCDINGDNQACNGGFMEQAFEFIKAKGGLPAESDYPYAGRVQTCKEQKLAKRAVSISGYETVPKNSEKSLQAAVANQPVSVAVDAGGYLFQFYSQGIFNGNCGSQLNHGVTIVGYGGQSGKKYWTVKNSWGTSWGESGYIRMKRNVSTTKGLCGIAMLPSYPVQDTMSN